MSKTIRKIRAFAIGGGPPSRWRWPCRPAPTPANETLSSHASASSSQSGSFLNNGFKSANWKVDEHGSRSPLGEPEILPSKVDRHRLPAGRDDLQPGQHAGMPATRSDPTTSACRLTYVVARCPNSVLGNGTAQFALRPRPDGRCSTASSSSSTVGRRTVARWSRSTPTPTTPTSAIYTEAALTDAGRLKFDIPQLTADSSVTTLDLAIPGTRQVLSGIDPGRRRTSSCRRARRPTTSRQSARPAQFPWDTKFTLGTRASDGTPTSPDTFTMDSGSEACTGVTGKAKITKRQGQWSVQGQAQQDRDLQGQNQEQRRSHRQGVRLKVSGRGVSFNTSVGKIGAGKTKTVKVKVKSRKKGKVKATFKVNSKNGGSKTANKTIKVR